ncbi:acetyl-CoA C-acyltransferase, partial [Myxococcota bacterium]|nr:acetyl-CoA C-acyltransferase [Myxococcota bacterium]
MATKKAFSFPAGRRVAIVAGLRTPFVKSGTAYKDLSALDLGKAVVTELLDRIELPRHEIEALVYGQVVQSVDAPNIAREIVLNTNLPRNIEAYSVTRACATSTQSTINATRSILLGEIDVAVTGGADSLSRPPITYSDNFIKALMTANSARDPMSKAKAFMNIKPVDLLPKPPALNELSTGLTMGQSAEKMAKENGISRADQDKLAFESHKKSAAAWEKGIYDDEVMHLHIPPKYKKTIDKDGLVRADTTLKKLEKLKPVFDRRYGTIAPGNS